MEPVTLTGGALTLKVNATRAIETGLYNGGFLTPEQVKAIAAEPTTRLSMILVRCGGGRFTAPAQDVAHFIAIIDREGSDYIRDVSLPAGFAVRGDSR